MHPLYTAQKEQNKKKRSASAMNADPEDLNQKKRNALNEFEKTKQEFVRQNQHDFANANWDALSQAYKHYVQITSEGPVNKEDDFLPPSQWPDDAMRKLQDAQEENERYYMLEVLNQHSPTSANLLTVRHNVRPHLAILDFYQILLLWQAERYQDVVELSKTVVNHVRRHYSSSIHFSACPLIPYYDAIGIETIEKYHLHHMINYLPLSEVCYYHAKAQEKLGTNPNPFFAMCDYFRAVNATAVDLLPQAKIYIHNAINLANQQVEYESLRDFVAFLMNENNSDNLRFLEKNTEFCAEYFILTLRNKKPNPKLLDMLSGKLTAPSVLTETKLLIYYARLIFYFNAVPPNEHHHNDLQNFKQLYSEIDANQKYEQYYKHVLSLTRQTAVASMLPPAFPKLKKG